MRREASVAESASPARTSDQHSATLGSLLADPWFGGQSSFGTLVRTPARGTLIGPPGARNDLRDDPIVEEVRTELEGPVYSADSLVAGPQVTMLDKSASRHHEDLAPRQFDLNAPLKIPSPPEGYFRFATVTLRADVPIGSQQVLDRQIGETSVAGALSRDARCNASGFCGAPLGRDRKCCGRMGRSRYCSRAEASA